MHKYDRNQNDIVRKEPENQIVNVEFDANGAVLIVSGKTGQRRVRLIHSVPRLLTWLEHHPNNGHPDSYLWVNLGSRNNSELLMHQSAASMLRKTGKRAGLEKGCNPHLFRHSRATFLAKHLTEAQMKEYFGWTQASDMAAIYVHLSGRDVDNALLKLGRSFQRQRRNPKRIGEQQHAQSANTKTHPKYADAQTVEDHWT